MSSRRSSLLWLAAALAGCSSVKINTQYDPAAPYPTYRTYAWLATAPGAEQAAPIRDPAIRQLVVSAIDRELARKGMVRTTPDANPDFFVSVLGWAQSRIEVTNYGYAYGGAYVYGPYGPNPTVVPAVGVSQYTDGTLLLDFVDARSRKLFWRGIATDTIASGANVKDSIDAVARKLLDAYPPPEARKK